MSNPVKEQQNQPDGKTTEKSPLPRQNNASDQPKQTEHGGCKGPEPTRYGDWENNGRCTDF